MWYVSLLKFKNKCVSKVYCFSTKQKFLENAQQIREKSKVFDSLKKGWKLFYIGILLNYRENRYKQKRLSWKIEIIQNIDRLENSDF